MPSRSSIEEICGPPPCTTTGRKPAMRRNTMSSANARFSPSSVMALPPYFTTMVLSWYCFSHGSAPARVAAFAVARCQAGSTSASSGMVISLVSSAAVGGVLVHVGVREVVRPHRGPGLARLEVDGHADLALLQVDAGGVLGRGGGAADPHAVHRHVEVGGVEGRVGGADGGEHPAPVRVLAVDRGLEQRAAGDRAADLD